jgi:hypothetical protein
MSEDEKASIIGKTMRQYVAEKQEAALIAGKLCGLGDTLHALGLAKQ